MPNIYLKHATHGAKVAISIDEAQADKRNGWVEFDPSAPAATQDNEPVVNALQVKRGRARKVLKPQGE